MDDSLDSEVLQQEKMQTCVDADNNDNEIENAKNVSCDINSSTSNEKISNLKSKGEPECDNNGEEITVELKANAKPQSLSNGCAKEDTNQIKVLEDVDPCSTSDKPDENVNSVMRRIGSSSLSNILVYGTDSSSSDSESDSESFESLRLSDNEEEESLATKSISNAKEKKKIQDTTSAFGELALEDLPPVPDLSKLNVSHTRCIHMGHIAAIIDKLVTIDSLPNMPSYDLDTILFMDGGKTTLGPVHDVMGPVASPVYVVRFNTSQEITAKGVRKGLPVYSAPETEHTRLVFMDKLMQTKGSDASWIGDKEVPKEHQEFSDDEKERKYRLGLKGDSRKRNSFDRHQDFEKDMNVKNIINSRLHNIRDSIEPPTKRNAPCNSTEKKGYTYQQNPSGPVYNFSQPTVTHPSVPSFNTYMAPFVQMPQQYPLPYMMTPMMVPQTHVPFLPGIPPPPIPHTMSSQSMLHPSFQPPLPPPPVDVTAPKQHPQPRVLYPPDMGLPMPRNTFVPLYNPAVANIWGYPTVRPSHGQPMNQSHGPPRCQTLTPSRPQCHSQPRLQSQSQPRPPRGHYPKTSRT